MTEHTDTASAAACVRVRTMPPIANVAGDSPVLSTAALRSNAFGMDVVIADGVEGVLPRGVPV